MDFFNKAKAEAQKNATYKESTQSERPIPWIEKYRPKQISEIAAQDEVVQVLKKSLETKNLPHLLFYGPPGTGKTSTILALAREMYGPEGIKSRVLELNASDERGISVVREKIKNFARATVSSADTGYPSPPYKIIILDEADSMTADAQAALRRVIENNSKITRFCLVCNYVSRIIEPLASRCAKFRFKALPREQAIAKLKEISTSEGVECESTAIEALVDASEGDLRRAVMSLQSASRIVGKGGRSIGPQAIGELVGVIPDDIIKNLKETWSSTDSKEIQNAIDELSYSGYPAAQALLQLHDAAMDDQQLDPLQKSKIALVMSGVDIALTDGSDEYLQMLDLMMQASKIVLQA